MKDLLHLVSSFKRQDLYKYYKSKQKLIDLQLNRKKENLIRIKYTTQTINLEQSGISDEAKNRTDSLKPISLLSPNNEVMANPHALGEMFVEKFTLTSINSGYSINLGTD